VWIVASINPARLPPVHPLHEPPLPMCMQVHLETRTSWSSWTHSTETLTVGHLDNLQAFAPRIATGQRSFRMDQ
jgi:hypothetical protein